MLQNAAYSISQENKHCEALCVIQEAERLRELTIQAYCGGIEVDLDFPSEFEAVTGDDTVPAGQVERCAERVQSAARAVAEDSLRLQSGAKQYATQVLAEFAPILADSQTADSVDSLGDSWNEQFFEALAVAREAERLQTLVVKMLTRAIEPEGKGVNDDD